MSDLHETEDRAMDEVENMMEVIHRAAMLHGQVINGDIPLRQMAKAALAHLSKPKPPEALGCVDEVSRLESTVADLKQRAEAAEAKLARIEAAINGDGT